MGGHGTTHANARRLREKRLPCRQFSGKFDGMSSKKCHNLNHLTISRLFEMLAVTWANWVK